MSISKFTKFTFVAISVSVLSVTIVSSLVTNTQSDSNNSSNNSIISADQRGGFGSFFDKMGNGAKNSFEGMKSGNYGHKMMNKMGDKTNKRMESEATKYKIDTNLVKAVTDAQKLAKEAQTAAQTARKNKDPNTTELETKAQVARKAVKEATKKFQSALFDVKIVEAKTLGVDQTVIDKFAAVHKTELENMDKMENLKNNPETKLSEIETLRKSMRENKQSSHEAQKAFRDAVKSKSPAASSQVSAPVQN